MSNAYNKRKGASAELEVVDFLRKRGHDTERLRLAGALDEGDVVTKIGGLPFVIEVKNVGKLNLSGWVKEAAIERDHYIQARGIPDAHFLVVHKRRGFSSPEHWYVTMPLWQWLDQVEVPF